VREKILYIGFAFSVLLLCLSPTSVGQSPSCYQTTTWWPGSDGAPPFGWICCFQYPGTFVAVIEGYLAKCPPAPETPVSCPICEATQPIVLTTGDTYIEENDVSLAGLGGGLTLSRRWNSMWPQNEFLSSVGVFGPNWKSTYEERVFIDSKGWVRYARRDGGYWAFGFNDHFILVPASPANVSATLVQVAQNTLQLTFQNGEARFFDLANNGRLTAISDRNGNRTSIGYDSYNRLGMVIDPAGRHLYFNYPNNSSNLVSSVTSDFGVTLSYSYDTQGRLTQVTKPDQTTVSFTYNAQSLISAVTDSNGKVLESHTYDSSGRGLTSSQANGVNAVSVTYPQ
jgi:YD repeat-containing protein